MEEGREREQEGEREWQEMVVYYNIIITWSWHPIAQEVLVLLHLPPQWLQKREDHSILGGDYLGWCG